MSNFDTYAQKHVYFRHFPPDSTFITNYLIPRLSKQGLFAGASQGILLPKLNPQDKPDYLPLEQASQLILDWLSEHSYLREQEIVFFTKLISQKQFSRLANTLQLITKTRLSDPNKLLTSRLTENLINYHQHLKDVQGQTPTKSQTNAFNNLQTYQQLRQRALQLALSGNTRQQIAQLLPRHLKHLDSNLTQQALASLIVSQLPELTSLANQHAQQPLMAQKIVANHLRQIIKTSRPDLTNFYSFLPAQEKEVLTLVQNLSTKVGKAGLQDLAQNKTQATQAIPHLAPSSFQLQHQLDIALSKYNFEDKNKIISTIFTTLNSTAKQPLSSTQLLNQVAKTLKLNNAERSRLTTLLQSSNLIGIIELNQHQAHLNYTSRRLTPAEKKLFKKGINPQSTQLNQTELRDLAQTLLPPQPLPQNNNQIAQLIQTQLQSESDYLISQSLHQWLDNYFTNSQLQNNPKLQHLINKAKRQREFFELPLSAKWYEVTDTLSGRRLTRKLLDKWDYLATNKAIVSIKLKNGHVLKIPLLRLAPWLVEHWYNLKTNLAIKALKGLRGVKNPFGKALQFSFRHYIKGGSTIAGALNSGWTEIWSKKFITPITKWVGVKYAAYLAREGAFGLLKGNAFKYLGGKVTNVAGRTTTRLLLKISSRGLAKVGGKVVTGLIGFASGIGLVWGFITTASLIFDLAKLGINFIREFLHNANFRNKALAIGTIITGALTAFHLAPLGLFLGSIGALVLQSILLAGGLTIGLLAFFMIFYNIFIKLPMQIDSGLGNTIANVVCNKNQDSSTISSNSTANAALCIAEVFNQIPGINPLFQHLLDSPLWQTVIQSLASFSAAIPELEHSAHIKNSDSSAEGNLQCVGLSAASAAGGGIPFDRQRNACQYATIFPQGYKYLPGCPNMQPGDHFIIGADNCWSDSNKNGTVGHIGVVINPNQGAKFTCVDANYLSPGKVRGPDECYFFKTEISGCLRKK